MSFFNLFKSPKALPPKELFSKSVNEAIYLFEKGEVLNLQNKLFEMYSYINKPGMGYLVTEYPSKDRLSECFSLCLRYDWMHESDIREVWAENGFYCIVTYMTEDAKTKEDFFAAAFDLFLLLYYGRDSLKRKISEILQTAKLRGNTIFDASDYKYGSEYLIRQFAFFSATIISPFVKSNNIITPEVQPFYQSSKNDFILASISPNNILAKAKFLAKVIESIVNDM